MRIFLCISGLISNLMVGSIASAQDFSFRNFSNQSSYNKDFLRSALEQGQLRRDNAGSYRDIDLDGIQYGNQDDIELFILFVINDVCPTCSTTSSGSTVRVKYGNTAGGTSTYVLNAYDYYRAEEIEDDCEELLNDHSYDRDGKDILIVDNNDGDDKIALCFDRD